MMNNVEEQRLKLLEYKLEAISGNISSLEARVDQGALYDAPPVNILPPVDASPGGSGVIAQGEFQLYKVLCLRGYKKVGEEWVAMTVEEELSAYGAGLLTQSLGEAKRSGASNCLRPTWDWVRFNQAGAL